MRSHSRCRAVGTAAAYAVEQLERRQLLSNAAVVSLAFKSNTTQAQPNVLPQQLVVTFDSSMEGEFHADNVRVENLSFMPGSTPSSSEFQVLLNEPTWGSDGTVATFTFKDVQARNGITGELPDGYYRATISHDDGIYQAVYSRDFNFIVGDADRNGKVDFDDYIKISNGFNNHLTGWTNGDFDLNGVVNSDDYVLIDYAYGKNYQRPSAGTDLIEPWFSTESTTEMDWDNYVFRLEDPDTQIIPDGWRVQRSTDGQNFDWYVNVQDPYATGYSANGLEDGTKYYWRTRAFGSLPEQNSPYTAKASFITTLPGALLSQPQALAWNQVKLEWEDRSQNESGFVIYYSQTGNSNDYTELDRVGQNATTYTATGLHPDTHYYFKVRAFNYVTEAMDSVALDTTTFSMPLPASPSVRSADGDVIVGWSNNAGAPDRVTIEMSTDGTSFAPAATVDASSESWRLPNAQPNTHYYFRLHATNGTDTSGVAATDFMTRPVAPKGFFVQHVERGTIWLAWTSGGPGITGYHLQWRPDGSGAPWTDSGLLSNSITSVSNLEDGSPYDFRVNSVNAAGTSELSHEVVGWTPLIKPVITGVQMASHDTLNIGWTPCPHATGYRVVTAGSVLAMVGGSASSAAVTVGGGYNEPKTTGLDEWITVVAYNAGTETRADPVRFPTGYAEGFGFSLGAGPSAGQVSVNWQNAPLGKDIMIWRRDVSFSQQTFFAGEVGRVPAGTTQTFIDSPPEGDHYYSVIAYDDSTDYYAWTTDDGNNGTTRKYFHSTGSSFPTTVTTHPLALRLESDKDVSGNQLAVLEGTTQSFGLYLGGTEPQYANPQWFTGAGQPVSVAYEISAGTTATEGTDFAPLSGVAVIPAGSPYGVISVTALSDSAVENDETVVITILSATSAAGDILVSQPAITTITIKDANSRLDIDSNNDSDYDADPHQPNDPEKQIEDDPTRPGKIVAVDDGDSDHDGIPDFADGMSLPVAGPTGKWSVGTKLVPVVLTVPASLPFWATKFKLVYDANDPLNGGVVAPSGGTQWSLGTGSMRLWKRPSEARTRDPHDPIALSTGEFLKSDTEYSSSQLGIGQVGNGVIRTVALWVEAVKYSTAIADRTITLYSAPTSSSTFAQVDRIRISAAQNITATEIESDQAIVSWPTQGVATTFHVWRSLQPDRDYEEIAVVDSSQNVYTDKLLAPGTSYYYKMTDGSGGPVPVVGSKVKTDVPGHPSNLNATVDGSGSVHLSWSGPSGDDIDRYAVLWSVDGQHFGLLAALPATQTTLVDEEPLDGFANYYRVVALRDNRVSDPTATASVTPPAENLADPAPPANQPDSVYFVARQFGDNRPQEFKENAKMFNGDWKGKLGHGFLMFTGPNGEVTATFSFHPVIFPEKDEKQGFWDVATSIRNAAVPNTASPGRVWESGPEDMDVDLPGENGVAAHEKFLMTSNRAESDRCLRYVRAWIALNHVGYEKGAHIPDNAHPGNTISANHIDPAPNATNYWVYGQNCFWWATSMIQDSGIHIPVQAETEIAKYDNGVGFKKRFADNESAKQLLRQVPQGAIQQGEGLLRGLADMIDPPEELDRAGRLEFPNLTWEARQSPDFKLPDGYRTDHIPDPKFV